MLLILWLFTNKSVFNLKTLQYQHVAVCLIILIQIRKCRRVACAVMLMQRWLFVVGNNVCHPPRLQSHWYQYVSNTILQVSIYDTVLSKVENPGSPNGPTMVDRWVVRVTFGWSAYIDVVRNDNETAMSSCVIYFQPVPKRHMIDMCSLITLKFERRLGSNTAKSPVIFQSKRV